MEARPREIFPWKHEKPILVFTDGAVENDYKDVSFGAVMVDASSGKSFVFGSAISEQLVNKWQSAGRRQVISQAELYPILVAKEHGAVILRLEASFGLQTMSLRGWHWSASHLWWIIFLFYRLMQSWIWSFNPVIGILEFPLRATLQMRHRDCALMVIRSSRCFYQCMSSAILHWNILSRLKLNCWKMGGREATKMFCA